MKIKTRRIVLAFTILLPYWLFLLIALCIFPGIAGFILGILNCLKVLILLICIEDDNEKLNLKNELRDSLIVSFSPFTMVFFTAFCFIREGKLLE